MNQPPRNRGATFRKCDFQIHTLRDANWSGPFHPIDGRYSFADALVADCRRKGITAVAITDHHDLCIWRTVCNAALNETSRRADSAGGRPTGCLSRC